MGALISFRVPDMRISLFFHISSLDCSGERGARRSQSRFLFRSFNLPNVACKSMDRPQ